MSWLALVLVPTIWVVDAANGPGTHGRDLQPVIEMARKGDTILVRAGSYSACTIVGKSLTIRGAGSAITTVAGAEVLGVPAGGFVLLSGLRLAAPPASERPGLWLVGPGAVLLNDCQVLGADGEQGSAAVHLSAGMLLHASRCSFLGGSASYTGPWTVQGGAGADVQAAAVLVASGCAFLGGATDDNVTGWTQGGAGVSVFGATALLFDSTCYGGAAGHALPLAKGMGGHAVVLNTGTVRVVGGQWPVLQGGMPAGFGTAAHTAVGYAVQRVAGNVAVHDGVTLLPATAGAATTNGFTFVPAGAAPRLAVNASYLPNGETDALQPLTVTYDGLVPNAMFFLIVGFRPALSSLVVPDLLIDLTTGGAMVGVLDGAGQCTVTFVPAWLLGLEGVPFLAQAGTWDPVHGVRTSNCDVRVYAH